MKTIWLGSKVMVSDPCYTVGTWCQGLVDNVLPGNYVVNVEKEDLPRKQKKQTKIRANKDYSFWASMKEWEKRQCDYNRYE